MATLRPGLGQALKSASPAAGSAMAAAFNKLAALKQKS